MPLSPPREALPTHAVENQPGPLRAALWDEDPALSTGLSAMGGKMEPVQTFAGALSSEAMREAGRAANRHPPELRLFDRAGRRLDEVAFHPAYHDLMRAGLEAGYSAIAWEDGTGGHVAHAAMVYLMSQVEPGVCCPMTMTYAAVPALSVAPELEAIWAPKLASRIYDPSTRPVAEKRGATLGMAMTEKQGGSDLRSNATRAEPDGDAWRLTGHKWFCSAPMSDGFLTLAQTPAGLTCFLVPRWLPDGRNAIQIQRLKEKLGNRSNASAEIEYHGALAFRIGEEGRGVAAIIEMVHHTRLDTAMAPAGLMRAALVEARHWAANRSTFGKRLVDQPLMRTVLADLSLEWEGALALGLRVASAFDDPGLRAFARVAVALAKFLSNKRAPHVICECMEALGGMGYVDDTPMPLLYREAPLNSIWEGSGNVICLDILRTLSRDPEANEALAASLDAAKGADARYDDALEEHRSRWPGPPQEESDARHFAERTATLLAAATLIGMAPSPIAESYVAARLIRERGHIAGSVGGLDETAILDRIGPLSDCGNPAED